MRRTALTTMLAALMALPATAGASEPAEPPMDYRAQASKLSQPIYPKTIKEVVNLPMADAAEPHGANIYLEITRPDPAQYPDLGKVPVILEASPYHGASGTRIGDRIFPDPKGQGNANLGLVGYFAPRGYAVVMMDLRGTGRSEGCLDHLGPKDASDMKAVIEWAASQPWSNGRVGMAGHSYVGASQNVAAAQRPKGLVTIVPSAGLASMYDHQYQKGVPWLLQWVGPMFAYEWLAVVRDLPPGVSPPPGLSSTPVLGGTSGDNWMQGGNPTQTGCGMQNSSLTAGSGQVTGQYELWHAKRDWREAVADADIPIFMVHGVNDNAARIPAAEWFFANRYRRDGDKVWIGQWDHGSTNGRCGNTSNARVLHPTCRFLQWQFALHAWFDHHLMQRTWTDAEGVEHPIDTGPPVEVFLNAEEAVDVVTPSDPATWGTKVMTADEWKKYPRVELYPDAGDMSLKFQAPTQKASKTYSGIDAVSPFVSPGSPHIGNDLIFQSAPLQEDSVFLGLPKFQLTASMTNSQSASLIATLSRVDAGGEKTPMNFCAINPLVRDGVGQLSPVVPGQVMDLQMQCFTMAHFVPAGQKLELKLSTNSPHHAVFGAEAQITMHTGPSATKYQLPKVEGFTLFDDVPLR